MTVAGKLFRPRVLATVFGTYFAIVLFAAWTFASRLSTPWFGAELSRWLYMTHIVAAVIFLCGTGLLAFKIVDAFEMRIRDVNRKLGKFLWDRGIVPPAAADAGPLEDGDSYPADPIETSLNEILEVLGQSQTEAVQEVLLDSQGRGTGDSDAIEAARAIVLQREFLRRRAGLRRHQTFLLFFLVGPVAMAVAMLGISMVMLPATEVMLQDFHELNTALILGFSYSWPGLAAYFGTSVLGSVASLRTERKRRLGARNRKAR